jgi:hypothetical protein
MRDVYLLRLKLHFYAAPVYVHVQPVAHELVRNPQKQSF